MPFAFSLSLGSAVASIWTQGVVPIELLELNSCVRLWVQCMWETRSDLPEDEHTGQAMVQGTMQGRREMIVQ